MMMMDDCEVNFSFLVGNNLSFIHLFTHYFQLLGIPKLDDANNAGTRKSGETTLIITEGDSAKALAVGGLGVVGRDNYGVFPLKVWNEI